MATEPGRYPMPPGCGRPSRYPAAGGQAPRPRVSFGRAMASAFRRCATFPGRARRSEYWWFTLAELALYVVAVLLAGSVPRPEMLGLLLLPTVLPAWALSVRRLHDTGRTGWWTLIVFVPFTGGIMLLVLCCRDSQPGANRYGPSPKYA